MKLPCRFLGLFGLVLAGYACQAQIVYSNVTATVTFTPSGGSNIPWATHGVSNQIIDFFAGQVPVIVGDSTSHTTATVNIIYVVDSSNVYPISQVSMVIQGSVFDWGRITWSETVEDLDSGLAIIGSAQGQFVGASYSGGTNGAVNFNSQLNLAHGSNHIKVKKTFTLDIDGQTLPTPTLASLSLVEQGLVPEPTTLASVCLGLAALALRRRRV